MSDAAMKNTGPAARSKVRPKYLNLVEIRLPLPGWVSILHRISGAALFVSITWLLWMLDRSLASEAGFEKVRHYATLWPVKLALLGLVWAYCHHFCAGIRYLLLDLHKGVELAPARRSSVVVLVVSLALTAAMAAKLW